VGDVLFDRLGGVAHRATATPGAAECGQHFDVWFEVQSLDVLPGALAKLEESFTGRCEACFSQPEPPEPTATGPWSAEIGAGIAAGIKADNRAAARELAERERDEAEQAFMPADRTHSLAEAFQDHVEGQNVRDLLAAREAYHAQKARDEVDPKRAAEERRRREHRQQQEQLGREWEAERKVEEERREQTKKRRLAAIITGKK
jgi:hypothetical protein